MKKILVASSALVAVAFAGHAQASEKISLSVSGYMNQWIGGASNGKEASGGAKNAFVSDTEVHFKGSTTLDNGIEVGAAIEFEAEGEANNNTDEQYLYINGGFGQVKLGQEDGAAADMTITAPGVGMVGVNGSDASYWANMPATPDNKWDSGDDGKLTYYTPVIGGFRAGVSYTDQDGSETNDNISSGDSVVAAGVEYKADFDGVSVAVAATGEHKEEGEWYNIGTSVGFGNVTVGGSYGKKDYEFGKGKGNYAGFDDDWGADIGVVYAMDAASVSLSYMYSEVQGSTANVDPDEADIVDLGLSYTLGAGVTWTSSVFWYNNDSKTASRDTDAVGAVTGLKPSF